MRYTTKDFPIKLKYWYLVHLNDFLNITLYPIYFINKVSVQRAIRIDIPVVKRMAYVAISGVKLRQYKLTYTIKLGKMPKFTKYEFDKGATDQQKKTRRTVIRRRLRRMGMLIPKRHKIGIKDKVKQARLLVNTQDVANCPNTEARAFRLERLSPNYYHIILTQERSKVKGIMFRCKCIRYNSKTKLYRKLFINIQNRDVIIPHLISEVYSKAHNNNNYERFKKYCIKQGVRLSKAWVEPKKVL